MNIRLAFLICLATLAGCKSDPVSAVHGELTGVYVLRTVNGVPLPALANGAFATEFRIVADTVRLYKDGYGEEVQVATHAGVSGQTRTVQPFNFSETGTATFAIAYVCNDVNIRSGASALTSCIAAPHHTGVRTSQGLSLNYSVVYRTPLVYERVLRIID